MDRWRTKTTEQRLQRVIKERALKKAQTQIAQRRISMDAFVGSYAPDKIQQDKARVTELERLFAESDDERGREIHKSATIMEALIDDRIEHGDWFGEGIVPIKTTAYDDYVNGVDSILECQPDSDNGLAYMALGIDVTIGDSSRKKLDRIKHEIAAGKMARIDYFHSEHTGITGQMVDVPRLIVSVDSVRIDEMMKLWVSKDAEQRESLDAHDVRFEVLAQIKLQLETYIKFARRQGYHNFAAKMSMVYKRLENQFELDFGDDDDFKEYVQENPRVRSFREELRYAFNM